MNTTKKTPQPLHISYITTNSNNTHKTLARPFIIHWPAKSQVLASRFSKKTFAMNFIDDTILITAARCSKKDQYSRKIGLRVATGRLNKLTKMFVEDYHLLSPAARVRWFETNQYCALIKKSDLVSPMFVFESCSIPTEVRNYMIEIYNRFVQERELPVV